MKIAIWVRLGTWLLGAALALVSGLVFGHRNDAVWEITRIYNEHICLFSLLPVAEVFILIDWIRTKKEHWKHTLTMLLIPLCFCIYIGIWVGCTGGV